MMEVVTVPPFERFYEEQQRPVLAQLRGMLGRDAADDAFQETFLRPRRAYPTLEHGRPLRAWALQIARNVALDVLRRTRATPADVPDLESVDEPLAYEEMRRLTAELPEKERAAVFLRYGYDLSYEDIGAALGSSPEAARQGTSSAVRGPRRKELSCPPRPSSTAASAPQPPPRGCSTSPTSCTTPPSGGCWWPSPSAASARFTTTPTRPPRRNVSPAPSARASCARRGRPTRCAGSSTSTSRASGTTSSSTSTWARRVSSDARCWSSSRSCPTAR